MCIVVVSEYNCFAATKCTGAGAASPANGEVTKSSGDLYLSTATFTCSDGFEFAGAPAVTCAASSGDEAWPTPDPAPTCAATACTGNGANAPTNGSVSKSGANLHTSAATFDCDLGYSLSGTSAVTCVAPSSDQPWPTPDPTVACVAKACDATEVENSDKSATGSIAGATTQAIPVTCDDGYTGSANAACQPGGTFTVVVCTPKPCGATQVANSDKSDSQSIAGTTSQSVAVNCNTGYSGSGDAVCQAGGSFTTVFCTDDPCPASGPESGSTPSVPETATGAEIAVTCSVGYSTAETATCNADNSWVLPACDACDGESEYADVSGLAACKACPDGSAGATERGGLVTLDGPHTACTDSTCEVPAARMIESDANAAIGEPCPDHGSHVAETPHVCALGCKPGYSGDATWTCKADSSYVTASYQGSTVPWCFGE